MRYIDYVNVKMGTRSTDKRSCGNVNPITAMPFGMNHYFLQTRNDYRWPFYADDVRTGGLRISHIPSPWIGDYSKLVLFPSSGNDKLSSLVLGKEECGYNIKTAKMTPAYIFARLPRYGVDMEFSPTLRGGIMRAKWYNEASSLISGGNIHRISVYIDGKECRYNIDYESGTVSGFTDNFRSWRADHLPRNFGMYFVLRFDRKISKKNTYCGEKGLSIAFNGSPKTVNCRFATSFISVDQARYNLESEVGVKNLETVKKECESVWENTLSKIEIDADLSTKKTFYSCLYRSFLFPRTFHEVCPDGVTRHFSPANGQICDGVMYTDNGFWDTYKTVYPLYSIIAREKYAEICKGLVNYYKEGGWLPRWMSPSALNCMPGTAVDAVFGDAAEKQVVTDPSLLSDMLEALLKHIDNPPESPALGRDGWDDFKNLGYVSNKYNESVNKTQDYSYGNYCASRVSKALGKTEITEKLLSTAKNYANLYDAQTGFLRAKDQNGNMRTDFTEFDWGGDYTEGGPWQNSFAMYHDFNGYSELLGGRDVFLKKIEQLFATPPYFRLFGYGSEIHEMTEMAICEGFGQCALSNQPSFHLPYMFSCLGDRDQSAFWVRKCVSELFKAEPDGFPGDEDNGSMSAWYVFSAMGFYPVCPGNAEYVLASPSVNKAVLHLENGCSFTVIGKNNSKKNVYATRISVNGKAINKTFITQDEIISGSELVFELSDKPSKQSYTAEELPSSLTK